MRNMNFGNHLNETNVAISLRVSVANRLKLVRIYLCNSVPTGEQTQTGVQCRVHTMSDIPSGVQAYARILSMLFGNRQMPGDLISDIAFTFIGRCKILR